MHAAPQIGSILLGKYRVERVLGQGGMGVVVAARHEHLGELFAIKMMLPEALAHPDARERFMREARAVARMKGEHVTRVHDVGALDNGAPCMVMEHLTGDDLSGLLDKRGALPVGEAALYVYQACEAVAEAHALGIVHRDLKPSNLFLTRRPNGTPCVKVLDFGIAKELDPNKVGPALTKTGMMVGTPVYMAPEQMANNKSTDFRSDIWSLGIILYELVTADVPFGGDSMTELVSQVLTKLPVPPSRVRPGIPPAFDAIVMRCLEKQPDRRFASVRDLMAALHPFVGASFSQTQAELAPTVRPSAPAPAANPPASAIPIGPHGLPRLNVTDMTTAARPLPFGANLPYVATVQTPMSPEPVAPVRPPAHSVPMAEPRQTNGAWSDTNQTISDKRGKTLIAVGLTVGALVAVGGTGLIVTRVLASSENSAAGSTAPSGSVVPSLPQQPAPPLPTEGPSVAAQPATSAGSVLEAAVGKSGENTGVARPTQSTNSVVETKPPVSKPPTSKIPDF